MDAGPLSISRSSEPARAMLPSRPCAQLSVTKGRPLQLPSPVGPAILVRTAPTSASVEAR